MKPQGLPPVLKDHVAVCSLHFLDTDFQTTNPKRRLKPTAVPSVFLSSEDHNQTLSNLEQQIVFSEIRGTKTKVFKIFLKFWYKIKNENAIICYFFTL